MPGKAGEILRRVVEAKVVQHKKRIELRDLVVAESSFEMNAGPFSGGPTL